MKQMRGKKKNNSSNILSIANEEGEEGKEKENDINKAINNNDNVNTNNILQEELYRTYLKENLYDFTLCNNTHPVSVYDFLNNYNYKGEVVFLKEVTHQFHINQMSEIQRKEVKINSIINDNNNELKPTNFTLIL